MNGIQCLAVIQHLTPEYYQEFIKRLNWCRFSGSYGCLLITHESLKSFSFDNIMDFYLSFYGTTDGKVQDFFYNVWIEKLHTHAHIKSKEWEARLPHINW